MTKSEQFYTAQNKLAKYDEQSKRLVLEAMEFEDAYNEQYTLPEMVFLLRNAYKERLTHFDVLGEKSMRTNTDPSSGFCLITSYLVYSMTGGDRVWEIYGASPLHWWLVHKRTNLIFDITYSQFGPNMLNNFYQNASKFNKMDDEQFMDMLKQKAYKLAHRAGLE